MSEDAPPPKGEMTVTEMARRGGKAGGPARAAKMTPDERSASASKAAKARWAKAKPSNNDKEKG